VAQSWRRHWAQICLFFAFAASAHKILYTTNALQASTAACARARNKSHFPNDEATTKLVWLALRNITAKCKESTRRLVLDQAAVTGLAMSEALLRRLERMLDRSEHATPQIASVAF